MKSNCCCVEQMRLVEEGQEKANMNSSAVGRVVARARSALDKKLRRPARDNSYSCLVEEGCSEEQMCLVEESFRQQANMNSSAVGRVVSARSALEENLRRPAYAYSCLVEEDFLRQQANMNSSAVGRVVGHARSALKENLRRPAYAYSCLVEEDFLRQQANMNSSAVGRVVGRARLALQKNLRRRARDNSYSCLVEEGCCVEQMCLVEEQVNVNSSALGRVVSARSALEENLRRPAYAYSCLVEEDFLREQVNLNSAAVGRVVGRARSARSLRRRARDNSSDSSSSDTGPPSLDLTVPFRRL